jgi:hypothetical protein
MGEIVITERVRLGVPYFATKKAIGEIEHAFAEFRVGAVKGKDPTDRGAKGGRTCDAT